jgi:ABC-type Na+ efflux pump permease subunit
MTPIRQDRRVTGAYRRDCVTGKIVAVYALALLSGALAFFCGYVIGRMLTFREVYPAIDWRLLHLFSARLWALVLSSLPVNAAFILLMAELLITDESRLAVVRAVVIGGLTAAFIAVLAAAPI